MPITFETEWVAAEEIRGPELASTWASLLIRVDDAVITRVLDQRAQTIRDRVYVPLYPLAESLVTNWWFLLHEVGNPVKNNDQAFKRRHALVSGPRRIRLSEASRNIVGKSNAPDLDARLVPVDQTRVPRQRSDLDRHGRVPRELRRSRGSRRSEACGVWYRGNAPAGEWASIQTADRDERLFCKTAAALGWIPMR